MKMYQNEEAVNDFTDLTDHYKMNFSDRDDEKEERDEEEVEEENQDWGDVDPAGGPAPSAPGSAV